MDSDSKEMLSFLWILRSWLLDCTAHGIPRVIVSTNFHRKIFWLVAFFVCCLGFAYQIMDMTVDIYTYPLTVNLQIEHKNELEFPTVTICNSNKLKESLLRAHNPDSDLYKVIIFEDFNSVGLKSIRDELVTRVKPTANESIGTTTESAATTKFTTSASLNVNCRQNRENLKGPMNSHRRHFLYNEFECEDANCVGQSKRCDGSPDCLDGSDEASLICGSCPLNKYECEDGSCIEPTLR